MAFLVDDSYQGHGIGTILLEHLASEARRHGIRQFAADTLSENHKMLSVFAEAGFVRQYQRNAEVMRVVLDIEATPEARAAADARDRTAVIRSIGRLLEPRTIAVDRRRASPRHDRPRTAAQPACRGVRRPRLSRESDRVPCRQCSVLAQLWGPSPTTSTWR